MALIDSTFVTKMNLVTSDFVTDMADYLKKSGLAMDEETLVKKGLVKESDKLDPFSLEAAAEKSYVDLQSRELELVNKLKEKYGVGTVDIASGEFIPAK